MILFYHCLVSLIVPIKQTPLFPAPLKTTRKQRLFVGIIIGEDKSNNCMWKVRFRN